ncbi:MAG: hypothetical protein ACRD0A_06950 [Acidimicrobiales bacterium]
MADIGTDISSEDFADGFYDSMDTDGIHVVSVIDTFAATGMAGPRASGAARPVRPPVGQRQR